MGWTAERDSYIKDSVILKGKNVSVWGRIGRFSGFVHEVLKCSSVFSLQCMVVSQAMGSKMFDVILSCLRVKVRIQVALQAITFLCDDADKSYSP